MKKFLLSLLTMLTALTASAGWDDIPNGALAIITNADGDKTISLNGGNAWDIKSINVSDMDKTGYCYVRFDQINVEGVQLFKLRMAKADGSFYTPSWADPANDGCINFQPGAGIFVGGNKNQHGTDAEKHGVFNVYPGKDGMYYIMCYGKLNYLVPGIGQSDSEIAVKLQFLEPDFSENIEAAWTGKNNGVPSVLTIDYSAAEEAYTTAKAKPTKANYEALVKAIADAKAQYIVNVITNPGAEENANGWTMVRDGGAPTAVGFINNPGNAHSGNCLFEPAGWGPKSAYMEQTVSLPAGKYVLTAYSMASLGQNVKIALGESESAEVAGKGDAGAERWMMLEAAELTLTETTDVVVKGMSATTGGQEWANFDDFAIWKTGEYVAPKNTIAAGKYTIKATVTQKAETIPAAFQKYLGEYETTATIEGDENSLVITENAEEGLFTGFEIAGDAVEFNATKIITLGGKQFTVRAMDNEAEAGSLALTPANEEGEYTMEAADVYYNGQKAVSVSNITILPYVAPEEIVVNVTYVDGSNPSTALYDATATQWQAGYNGISNGSVTYARADWNCNWITYVGVDASTMKGESVTKATLKMEVSGSTDSKRNTTWGVGYNATPWSATMTDETADKSITLLGGTQNSTSKASGAFNELTFDVTGAFKDSKVATLLIYETAAAGGYVKNITIEMEFGSALEAAKSKALEAADAIPAGDGLFLCPQEEIDAYKAAVEAATTVEEIEALQLPEIKKPTEGTEYQMENVSAAGMYLGQAKICDWKVPVVFEETEGGYYLKIDGMYLNMAGGNTWSMNATETPSTVWKINVAEGNYTIQGPNGIVGTDSKEAGSATYGNKTAAQNGTWTIEIYNGTATEAIKATEAVEPKVIKYIKDGQVIIGNVNAAAQQMF